MNECSWAKQAAMFLGEPDCPPELMQHISGCSACRTLLHELQNDRAQIAAPPPLPSESFQVLRAGVRRRVAVERTKRWSLFAAGAAAAAALFIVFDVQPRKDEHVQLSPAPTLSVSSGVPANPVHSNGTDGSESQVPRVALTHRKHSRDSGHGAVLPPMQVLASDGRITVRKQTADPNVVILLVGETGEGDGDE